MPVDLQACTRRQGRRLNFGKDSVMASPAVVPRSRAELLARYQARSAEFDAIARRRRPDSSLAVGEALFAPGSEDPGRTQLSERELAVIDLIANGLTNSEIGKRLFLAEETVKSHLRNILAKLGARNRAHAVALAFRGAMVS
jgi:DNA-binding NarL/FixJ family response regulator